MHTIASLFWLLDDNSGMNGAGLAAFFGAYFIFVLVVCVIAIIIYWRIAMKMGYPGWYSLGLLIPLLNLILIILVAFTEWPIERELKALRGGGRTLTPTA